MSIFFKRKRKNVQEAVTTSSQSPMDSSDSFNGFNAPINDSYGDIVQASDGSSDGSGNDCSPSDTSAVDSSSSDCSSDSSSGDSGSSDSGGGGGE